MIQAIKNDIRSKIADGLVELGRKILGEEETTSLFKPKLQEIIIEIPPNDSLGDLAFPTFSFAKTLRMPPPKIAEELSQILLDRGVDSRSKGPYVNISLDRANLAKQCLSALHDSPTQFGQSRSLMGKRYLIEFSSPNTNKPLHLGHLRNNILGESLSRILNANGAEVHKVNLVNDRGIHICKSMLAYQERKRKDWSGFNADSPESAELKGDHFVGNYYVAFSELAKQDSDADRRAQELLIRWESGDAEVRSLWAQMRDWAMKGLMQSYERTGISFDSFNYESETYTLGKKEVLRGLEEGLFYKDSDGKVLVDLAEDDTKVLLRSDGTSVYITQDIGTAISRYKEWQFDTMIYVVASEQKYHFRVLFYILEKLGYNWAKNLSHFSYGMVNIPEGKMKSREGTVVDADDLLDRVQQLVLEEIRSKGRESELENSKETAEKVALAALHYYLLQVNPNKEMMYIPEDSIALNGNTGPYLQYMGARIANIFRKHKSDGGLLPDPSLIDWGVLKEESEWKIIKLIASFSESIEDAAEELDPSILCNYLYQLAKEFSRFYQTDPVLNCPVLALRNARLHLALAVSKVLREGCELLNIPYVEAM